jgi:hypothetical protein
MIEVGTVVIFGWVGLLRIRDVLRESDHRVIKKAPLQDIFNNCYYIKKVTVYSLHSKL